MDDSVEKKIHLALEDFCLQSNILSFIIYQTIFNTYVSSQLIKNVIKLLLNLKSHYHGWISFTLLVDDKKVYHRFITQKPFKKRRKRKIFGVITTFRRLKVGKKVTLLFWVRIETAKLIITVYILLLSGGRKSNFRLLD